MAQTFGKVAGAYGLKPRPVSPMAAAVRAPAQAMAQKAAVLGKSLSPSKPVFPTGPVSLDNERYSNRPFLGGQLGRKQYF
jgi:hypothetical protein